MARQMNYPNSKELLTTPPPIVDSDVSARWKRTWKREVVMTVILPDDVVDTELYVKTTRGHIGIQMDPWMSCSWKRNWSSSHPPNTQTKEKMRKFRLQRAGRRMSLFRTSGRNSYRSPRPDTRWCKNIFHKHNHTRRTPSPSKSAVRRHNKSPSPQLQWARKPERDWSDSTDSAPETAAYHEQSPAAPEQVKSTLLSPESPPDYERGLSTTDYIPKSPIYHPAGYSDEEEDSELDSEFDFNLDEENWDEDNSPTSPKNPNPPEEEAPQKDTPAEQKERSPTPQPNQTELLTGLTRIADTVNPASSADPVTEPANFKKRRMFNSYKRLDMSYKMKDGHNKEDDQDKTTQTTGMDPIQEDDKPTKPSTGDKFLVTIPLEPMTSPPAIIHPIPATPSSQPPDVPANFSAKLNRVAKMRTGPICYKAKLVQAMNTRPRVILQRLPLEGKEIHSDTI